ncbi:hypothetical protein [Helicobacter heilmannii]|uniref:hypothetical protein n=1 Tax=Helicobacter heilmannii TaxID=35817 RepID=UPI0012E10A43|nr:hypothetical protein [Helicobacter heilmannii]
MLFAILWIKRTRSYKDIEVLPKGTFIAICLSFLTFLRHKRFILGILSLASFIFYIGIYTLFLISTVDLHHPYSTGTPLGDWALMVANAFNVLPNFFTTEIDNKIVGIALSLGRISFIFQLIALGKCVGADLAQQETIPTPLAPDLGSPQSIQNPNVAILLSLDNRHKIAFLEHKTPLEIASIQASLGDLPLEKQISIQEAIKESIEQVLQGEQYVR